MEPGLPDSTMPRIPGRRGGLRVGPRFLGVLMGLALVIGGAVWLRRPTPPAAPAALPELTLAELENVDGRLRPHGGTGFFTGFLVERGVDGRTRARSAMVDGRLEGVSEGWYPDGGLQVREFFRAGVSHGVRTKWHPNGQRASEASIVEGKLQGPFRRWHENGQLAERMEMRDGEADGVVESYYPSGFRKVRATVRAGKVIGQDQWADGEVRELAAQPVAAPN